jgi:hypothetical protein
MRDCSPIDSYLISYGMKQNGERQRRKKPRRSREPLNERRGWESESASRPPRGFWRIDDQQLDI